MRMHVDVEHILVSCVCNFNETAKPEVYMYFTNWYVTTVNGLQYSTHVHVHVICNEFTN